MTKQWRDPNIQQKPFSRYNPSLKKNFATVYRPWYLVVAAFLILIGIVLVGCSIALKQLDSNIKDSIFLIWVAVPLIASGMFALVCFVFKKKSLVTVFLLIMIIVTVTCAIGSLTSGLRFWMDNWQRARRDYDDNKCSLNANGKCNCKNIMNAAMPTLVDSCDDLNVMIKLVIAEITLSTLGFAASVMGMYLAFMSICCGPWMYMEWYDEVYDPDFKLEPPVRHTKAEVNPAYGGYN